MKLWELEEAVDNKIGGRRYFNQDEREELRYSIVAVLNPNEGPDEQLLEIDQMTWDHQLGVLRLEIWGSDLASGAGGE